MRSWNAISVTSLDGINGRSIQTLLRAENVSKQSDEFQATFHPETPDLTQATQPPAWMSRGFLCLVFVSFSTSPAWFRLRVVPFFLKDSRERETRSHLKITPRGKGDPAASRLSRVG